MPSGPDRSPAPPRPGGPSAGRIPTVEGLRGLAALIVVFDHVIHKDWGLWAWSQQNHGITLFAVLTGFLLSAPFLRARLEGRPAPRATAFLRARAARIYPGYWVALGGAALDRKSTLLNS